MNALGLKEFVENFDCEHGGEEKICVVKNNWVYFPDGAKREVNSVGVACKPSQDVFQCAKDIVYFWELKLELAINEFQHHKQRLIARTKVNSSAAFAAPAPSNAEIENLKELQAKVKVCQNKLQEAKENLDNNKPEKLREREALNEQNRQANQEVLNEILAIEV